jgi:hypothetical protein
MKNITQSIIKYTIWAFIFIGATSAYAVGTWTDATWAPPTSNTDTPINTGTTAQNKTGSIGATQYCDSAGANCLPITSIVSTSSATQTKTGFLWSAGFGSSAGGYFATTLGVGTSTDPATKSLSALFNGNIGANSYCDRNGADCVTPAQLSSIVTSPVSGVPSGAVMAFNLASCPTGWTEAIAAQGRYVVGKPSSGSLGGIAGTALTNLENRATGVHSHTITDPRHSHTFDAQQFTADTDITESSNNLGPEWAPTRPIRGTSLSATGITINNSVGVSGTNAPYIQYLMCQKN